MFSSNSEVQQELEAWGVHFSQLQTIKARQLDEEQIMITPGRVSKQISEFEQISEFSIQLANLQVMKWVCPIHSLANPNR